MKIGVIFPQVEIGEDVGAIREFILAAEELGYAHLAAYDHILGANPDRPGGWQGLYTHESAFYEPLTLFSFAASITSHLGLTTGILILPQRQTALVAKQAATLDLLSGGRLRLGIGIGWNEIEYIALREDFHNRGRRIEEQVEVLRALWTQPLVTFSGRWHTILDAGLNPLPVQRPIPIWFGGHAEAVLHRTARLGDGWMPTSRTPEEVRPQVEALYAYVEQAGRPRETLGLEGRVAYGQPERADWESSVREWQSLGATHLSLNTMRAGLATPAQHIEALQRFARDIGLSR